MTTIRAFGAQKPLQQEFDDYQNLNVSAWFTFVGCARSFGLWLDLHCVIYVALVTVSFLFLQLGQYTKQYELIKTSICVYFIFQKLLEEM